MKRIGNTDKTVREHTRIVEKIGLLIEDEIYQVRNKAYQWGDFASYFVEDSGARSMIQLFCFYFSGFTNVPDFITTSLFFIIKAFVFSSKRLLEKADNTRNLARFISEMNSNVQKRQLQA